MKIVVAGQGALEWKDATEGQGEAGRPRARGRPEASLARNAGGEGAACAGIPARDKKGLEAPPAPSRRHSCRQAEMKTKRWPEAPPRPSLNAPTERTYTVARPAFFQTSVLVVVACATVGEATFAQTSKADMVPAGRACLAAEAMGWEG